MNFRIFSLDCFSSVPEDIAMIYVCGGEKFTMIEFDFHSGFKSLKAFPTLFIFVC